MRKMIIACAVLIAMPVAPAAGEPLVRMHTSYYYIDGPSATVLAAQLDQNGPPEADGKRHAGKTRWDVQWKFRHQQQATGCSMKEVSVAVAIAQTLPRWRGEDKGAAALRARWTKFLEALQRHEAGHKEHALKAGKEIEAAVAAVKPASNCEDLSAAANVAADAIVAKYRALGEDYDRTTDHGRSQGATLL
jgi:predicted secreted Zn-dependent protease